MGLWLTFLLGIFIILGALIVFYTDNSEKFIEFSISLAAGVILMLIGIDLIPEMLEVVPYKGWFKYFAIISGIAFGFVILLVLDKFIPDHEDDEKTDEDDHKNLEHIGLMSTIALILHNIVDGMAIYILATSDIKAAFITCIGIVLHNIPMGMVIASAFYQQNESKKKTFIILGLVSLSTFVGGLSMFLFNLGKYVDILEAISITLTIGMLLFILIRELLPKMKKSKDKRITSAGFLTGIVLLLITLAF